MTQKEFIKVLDESGYSYQIKGDRIIVTHEDDVDLQTLDTIPSDVEFENGGDHAITSISSGVVFRNSGHVIMRSLPSLPSGVEFENAGNVGLPKCTSLPPVMEFKNEGLVVLTSITSISPGVNFKNGGDVFLGMVKIGRSLIGGFFSDWQGNMVGIDSNRLLNVMIKQGVFI